MDGMYASQELDTLPPEELEFSDDQMSSGGEREVLRLLGRAAAEDAVEEIEDADDDDEDSAEADTLPLPGRPPAGAVSTAAGAAAAAVRQPRVFRRWMITFNNPPGCDEDMISLLQRCEWIRGAVFQRERGHGVIIDAEGAQRSEGTLHYQMYIEAKRAVSMLQVKKLLPLAHIEWAQRPPADCIAYCSKEDTRVSGPHTVGLLKGQQGKRNDLSEFAKAVLDPKKDLRAVVAAQPEMVLKYGAGFQKLCSMRPCVQRTTPRRIVIMVGPTGCGKTMNAIAIGGEDWHWKTADGNWFDGYCGQKTVIIDEITACDFSLSLFLQLIDRYVFRVAVKGGFTEWNPDTVVMTSNVVPTEWFAWEEAGKRKRNQMTILHFRAFARRVTEYWQWDYAGNEPRKLLRARQFGDPIDAFFEGRCDWERFNMLV